MSGRAGGGLPLVIFIASSLLAAFSLFGAWLVLKNGGSFGHTSALMFLAFVFGVVAFWSHRIWSATRRWHED